MKQKEKARDRIQPSKYILLSFLFVILTGSLLLCLPISNVGESASYLDNLFMATSATCVTGLVTLVAAKQYTLFGQIVLLILIQIGGLGMLTFLLFFSASVVHQKMSLRNKGLLVEALNLDSFEGIVRILKYIIRFTFTVECVGAILLFSVLMKEMDVGKAMFTSIFLSVSAFCNAGFDTLGANSVIPYNTNVLFSLTLSLLIIIGSLGFTVWFEVLKKGTDCFKNKQPLKRLFQSFSLHSKLVVCTSFILLLVGTIFILIVEWNNPSTIGTMGVGNKIVTAFFASTTLRTAGFAPINYGLCTRAVQFICLFLMLIGGSPGGTSGGIKTTTFMTILLSTFANLRGTKKVVVFNRQISTDYIQNSLSILMSAGMIIGIATTILLITEDFSFMEILFEVVSALATVGLTLGITANLSIVGKIVIILLMYIGRVGILTLIMHFTKHNYTYAEEKITYPVENILLG